MPSPFERLAGLDREIHEPGRLAILTALSNCRTADFLFLQRLTGLSRGNLSSHLSRLAGSELISVEKQFVGKTPNTLVRITVKGQSEIDTYWQRMVKLRQEASQWPGGEDQSEPGDRPR